MKKILLAASVLLAVACQSPESRTETTSDSLNNVNENGVTNSPPGGSTDTAGGMRMDTSSTRDSMNAGTTSRDSTTPR